MAEEIQRGDFKPVENPEYTHPGSIGNLSTGRIKDKLDKICNRMQIEKYRGFQERIMDKIKNEVV